MDARRLQRAVGPQGPPRGSPFASGRRFPVPLLSLIRVTFFSSLSSSHQPTKFQFRGSQISEKRYLSRVNPHEDSPRLSAFCLSDILICARTMSVNVREMKDCVGHQGNEAWSQLAAKTVGKMK